MKKPSDLTREELIRLVGQLQAHLYLDMNSAGEGFWNPDKDWDSDTLAHLAELLVDVALAPEEREV